MPIILSEEETAQAIRLAYAFTDAVWKIFAGGPIPMHVVADANAHFTAAYFVQMPPTERALMMTDMVNKMLAIIHDNPCTDILIN